jgi:hypothetical protein
MEPIFDRNGKTVGWLREDVVYDLDGANLAFVFRGALFEYNGKHVGSFSNKFFLDEEGKAVAFVRGARGAIVPPLPSAIPIPPKPMTTPSPARTTTISVPSMPPVHSLTWSDKPWAVLVKHPKQ